MLHEEMELIKRIKNQQKVQNFCQKKQESDSSYREKETTGRQKRREQEMASDLEDYKKKRAAMREKEKAKEMKKDLDAFREKEAAGRQN